MLPYTSSALRIERHGRRSATRLGIYGPETASTEKNKYANKMVAMAAKISTQSGSISPPKGRCTLDNLFGGVVDYFAHVVASDVEGR